MPSGRSQSDFTHDRSHYEITAAVEAKNRKSSTVRVVVAVLSLRVDRSKISIAMNRGVLKESIDAQNNTSKLFKRRIA
uniref:Uncharacterized protein n=1 Tax=Pristionchus pacificus TaxID=54126 RepID=A0A2A6CGT9_PRIPA|eukprot:PDM77349.1 hypothetical protein PRIPAC_33079 [Pristionchus pacificus]